MQSQQKKSIDPHYRIKSLDNHYYVHNFNTISKVAIIDHYPVYYEKKDKIKDEIFLRVGDVINIFLLQNFQNFYTGYIHNGYMKGKNLRTNEIGLFPSYKVISYTPLSSDIKNISLEEIFYYTN
jgi:glycoprotein 6-alpha-L-fucosyltransferase